MDARRALVVGLIAFAATGSAWTTAVLTAAPALDVLVHDSFLEPWRAALALSDGLAYVAAPLALAWAIARRRPWGEVAAWVLVGATGYAAALGWGLLVSGHATALAAALMTTALAVASTVAAAVRHWWSTGDDEPSPRVAASAGVAWNCVKTLAQTAAMWAVFLFVLPAAIDAFTHRLGVAWSPGAAAGGLRWAGTGLFVLAGALGLWTGGLFATLGGGTPLPLDTAQRLVTAGPYAFVRNPMAVASIVQGVGVGLFLGSPWVLAYAAAGALVWHVVARPWEERDLEARFGDAYARYRQAVPLWLPRLSRYRDA